MLNIKSIVCSQCGSSDVTVKSDELAICNSCGSKIAIRPDVYNVTQAENTEDGKVMGISIIPMVEDGEFEKKYSPEFVRKVWLKIASGNVPLDVFDCSLEEMQLETYEMLVQSISDDVSYSASIGYDRQEPYLDTEKYYVTVNGQREERERTVTKYKTVTDWSPVSGVNNYEFMQGASNNPDQPYASEYYHSMMGAMMALNKEEAKGKMMEANVSAKITISNAVKSASEMACSMSLPGDHKRDVRLSVIKEEIKNEFIIIGLLIKTAINYKNERYPLSAIATDSMEVAMSGSLPNPGNPDEIFEKEKKEIEDAYRSARSKFDENQKRLSKKLIWSCMGIAVLGIILFIALNKTLSDLAWGLMYATWLIPGPASAIWCYVRRRKAEKAMDLKKEEYLIRAEQKYNKAHSGYMADKLKALNNVLSKYGLEKAEMSDISKN